METVNKFRLGYEMESDHYSDSCMPYKYVSTEGKKIYLKMGILLQQKKCINGLI